MWCEVSQACCWTVARVVRSKEKNLLYEGGGDVGKAQAEDVEAGNCTRVARPTADQPDHSGTNSRVDEGSGNLAITNVTVGRKKNDTGELQLRQPVASA